MLVKVDTQVFLDPVKVGSVTFKETHVYGHPDISTLRGMQKRIEQPLRAPTLAHISLPALLISKHPI